MDGANNTLKDLLFAVEVAYMNGEPQLLDEQRLTQLHAVRENIHKEDPEHGRALFEFLQRRKWFKSPEIVELFGAYVAARHIRPNERDKETNLYPLEYAVLNSHSPCLALLLHHGADERVHPGDPAQRNQEHPDLYAADLAGFIDLRCSAFEKPRMLAVLRQHVMARSISTHSAAVDVAHLEHLSRAPRP